MALKFKQNIYRGHVGGGPYSSGSRATEWRWKRWVVQLFFGVFSENDSRNKGPILKNERIEIIFDQIIKDLISHSVLLVMEFNSIK